MIWVCTLIFILLVAVIIKAFDLNPDNFADGITSLFHDDNRSLKDMAKDKTSRIGHYLKTTLYMLEYMGKRGHFSICIAASFLCLLAAVLLSMMINNPFLMPVLSAASVCVPYLYLQLKQRQYKDKISNELESGLSIITTSFVRNGNVVKSIEENIQYLGEPVKSAFEQFLFEVNTVDPNVDAAIVRLRSKLDNSIFYEWCEGLRKCYRDHTLKEVLSVSLQKLSDIRLINNELKTITAPALSELRLLSALVAAIIPIVYFLQRDWFYFLVGSTVGKVVLAICAGIILFANIRAVVIARSVTFDQLTKKGGK